jgi:hypothetical protein
MTVVNWIAAVCRARVVLYACTLLCAASAGGTAFAAADPIKVAVYPFELEDFSAAGGVVPTNARDAQYLAEATAEAKRWLAQSGRYTLVDTSYAQDELAKTHTLHACQGCVGPITRTLGADQAVIGLITRISRTEYTLLIQFYDAGSGEPVARYFTGLRMGADYSWPRGVTWLMKNRILAKDRD